MGNVAASAIWGPVGFVLGAAWAKRKIIHPIHRRLDRHESMMDELHRFHRIGVHSEPAEVPLATKEEP